MRCVQAKKTNRNQMLFKGINNQTVEFRITNYQYPEITDCEYDSNWLLIYLKPNLSDSSRKKQRIACVNN